MKLMKALLATASLLASTMALADRDIGNGGDTVKIDFVARAQELMAQVKTHASAIEKAEIKVNLKLLRQGLDATVESTDEIIYIDGVRKEAKNDPVLKIITVNRQDWKAIATPLLRDTLILHELIGVSEAGADDDNNLSIALMKIISAKVDGSDEREVPKSWKTTDLHSGIVIGVDHEILLRRKHIAQSTMCASVNGNQRDKEACIDYLRDKEKLEKAVRFGEWIRSSSPLPGLSMSERESRAKHLLSKMEPIYVSVGLGLSLGEIKVENFGTIKETITSTFTKLNQDTCTFYLKELPSGDVILPAGTQFEVSEVEVEVEVRAKYDFSKGEVIDVPYDSASYIRIKNHPLVEAMWCHVKMASLKAALGTDSDGSGVKVYKIAE